MDLLDQIPILILHVLETDISQDSSIVDEDIDAAKCLDGSGNNGSAVLDAVVVGNGLSASGLDLVDNYIGGLWVVVSTLDLDLPAVKRGNEDTPSRSFPRP
jgi:hypothetical protein